MSTAPVISDDRSQDLVVKSRSADGQRLGGDSSLGEAIEYYHYDEVDNTFTHEIVQDVEPVLKHIQGLRLDQGSNVGQNKAKDFYLAGSFPPVIIHAWLNQRGLKLSQFRGQIVKDFLNDPEHAAFRIWPGKV